MTRIVYFVCTSNTCRSPMAEAIGRRWFAEKLGCHEEELLAKGLHVASGGLTEDFEPSGSPASAHGITAMQALGYDTSAHVSRVLQPEDMLAAHAIYCVSQRHVRLMQDSCGNKLKICKTLGADIPDPWHGPLTYYQETARTMAVVVPDVLQREWDAGTFGDIG